MILRHLKQTLRGLRATKLYSAVNIIGFALGITCTLIVIKFIHFELSTDKFHRKTDRLYYSTIHATPLSKPSLLQPSLFFRTDYSAYPEISDYTSVSYNFNEKISCKQRSFKVNILAADSNFTRIFDFQLINRDLNNVLRNPDNIILSQKLSTKIFGKKNPMGEFIEYDGQSYTVAGVLAKNPGNSSMNIDVILSRKAKYFWEKGGIDFICFHKNSSINSFNTSIAEVGRKHPQFPESTVKFQPFSEFYFNSELANKNKFFNSGDLKSITILAIISTFVLFISVFNFINIYNVSLLNRSKELGIKKVLGAGRSDLIFTFLKEVAFCVFVSVLWSYLIFLVLIPSIRDLTDKEISVNLKTDLTLYIAAIIILTVVISIFPAIKYSVINPIKLIKESFSGKRSTGVRKLMMTAQYIVTMVLIIVSIFFIKQLNFMLNKDLGFNKDNIIKVWFFESPPAIFNKIFENDEDRKQADEEYRRKLREMYANQQFIIDEIKANPRIENLCFGTNPLTNWTSPWRNLKGDKDYESVSGKSVTPNFIKLYGLKLIEGRFFNRDIDQSRQNKVVINKKAKEFFGIDNLDDAYLINRYWGAEEKPYKVIGIIDNFKSQHLSKSTEPLIMFYWDDKMDESSYMMHITKGNNTETISFLKDLFEKVNTDRAFKYEFVEDSVNALYENDKKLVRIASIFTLIAVFISSLGLFSFSIFDVEQRTREIGIRKVNGARAFQIVQLLVRNFLILLGFSFVIAIPLAWFAIQKYLENFAHKAPISWWLFVLAAIFTFMISMLTLLFQTWKAANKNPVESLRYE